jgi:hypothetical protein
MRGVRNESSQFHGIWIGDPAQEITAMTPGGVADRAGLGAGNHWTACFLPFKAGPASGLLANAPLRFARASATVTSRACAAIT